MKQNDKENSMIRSVPAAFLILIFLAGGCSQSLYMKGKTASDAGDYPAAVSALYESIGENPGNYEAWYQLGLAYYRQGALEKAEEAFSSSNKIKPNADSNYYLGLIFEQTGQIDKAIRVYGAAVRMSGGGKTKELIEGRLGVLIDNRLTAEAREAVRKEDSLSTVSIPENSIAVISFDGSTLPPELEPLALGLAEFTAIDLAKVSSLRVLERLKIDVILDELKIGESRYADPSLAPRVGRLLGSRNVVLGSVTGTGDNSFRLDGKLVNTVDDVITGAPPEEGELDRFFKVQKSFVFDLIDTLGIKLSKKERDAIEEVPTESFLAFMAYGKGLGYERKGMYGEALESFKEAGKHDPGFHQASGMAGKMEQAQIYSGGTGGGQGSSTGEFEKMVSGSMKADEMQAGMGQVQASNLINSNFIMNNELYWYFGNGALAPPGGGPVWSGYGTILIKGELDAD